MLSECVSKLHAHACNNIIVLSTWYVLDSMWNSVSSSSSSLFL